MPDRLRHFGDDLRVADGPVVDFYSFPYPTRMAMARLSDGGLWVWSPIHLDPQLKDEVEALGEPAHLVSPNKIHHLFVGEWKAAYPGAKLWGLPTVARDLEFGGDLGDLPPKEWEREIDQTVFRGSLVMDEVVFFHRASRTAVVADLLENFPLEFLRNTPGWRGWRTTIARLWRITERCGMAPLELRLSFVRRRVGRKALNKMLARDPAGVVIAHGTGVTNNGREFIQRSFRWLGRRRPPK